jgi:HTH-type transcriptional regulator/antitoxin HigA
MSDPSPYVGSAAPTARSEGKRDPVAAIKAFMAEHHLQPRDLLPVFGTRARVSEVLNYRRTLTLDHIRVLHFNLGIDASALLHKYHRRTA